MTQPLSTLDADKLRAAIALVAQLPEVTVAPDEDAPVESVHPFDTLDHLLDLTAEVMVSHYGREYLAEEYRSDEGLAEARMIMNAFRKVYHQLQNFLNPRGSDDLPSLALTRECFAGVYGLLNPEHPTGAYYRQTMAMTADELGLGDLDRLLTQQNELALDEELQDNG